MMTQVDPYAWGPATLPSWAGTEAQGGGVTVRASADEGFDTLDDDDDFDDEFDDDFEEEWDDLLDDEDEFDDDIDRPSADDN